MPPKCEWLVLVPTELEARHLSISNSGDVCVEICGFGPVIAAARTAALIEKLRPAVVLLCGIAGTYSDDLPKGKAYQFEQVACYGIGAGTGDSFMTSAQMGWMQWRDASDTLGDKLQLKVFEMIRDSTKQMLVSACAVSTDQMEVEYKKFVYPAAVAEDMEGFAVAAAARLAGVPTCIVRGISNTAGDRRGETWQIEAAMKSVDHLVRSILHPQP